MAPTSKWYVTAGWMLLLATANVASEIDALDLDMPGWANILIGALALLNSYYKPENRPSVSARATIAAEE